MGKVIRSDLYRLFRQKSFYICTVIVALLNVAEGPISKILYNITKALIKDDEEALKELGDWVTTFKFSDILSNPFGRVDTVFILLAVVLFAYADLSHGYIKNIAGQLSKKGNIVISKMTVISVMVTLMMVVAIAFNFLGYVIVRTPDFTTNLADGFVNLGLKLVFMMAICSILLLIVVGFHSQIGGSVFAVVLGGGLTSVAYIGINKLFNDVLKFESFNINEYMPDSTLRETFKLSDMTPIIKALVAALAIIFIICPLTISLFNKKDVK